MGRMAPVVLIIRDGWGENHHPDHDAVNAVKLARTPVADHLRATCPRVEIAASGLDVGLPAGIFGNSEVGHQNIGAGRIVDQEIVRIDKALAVGSLLENPVLQQAFDRARAGGKLHVFGLISDAGVHAQLSHVVGLLKLAKSAGLTQVYLHVFADGRDTPPFSGRGYVQQLEGEAAAVGIGVVASVTGRFWAMDRDLRWDRIEPAYRALTGQGEARTAPSATAAFDYAYANPVSPTRKGDEFVLPTCIVDADGRPVGLVEDGDAVIFANFRGDRPRELTRAFIEEDFKGFERGQRLDLYFATMTEYEKGLCPNVLFAKPPKMTGTLGEVVANAGLAQFRCAETEKFPHVTFFFNDYREEPFPGEDRAIVPSPKEVPTYDLKPEMSAFGVRDAAAAAIRSGKYALVVVNFANPDMVGHTGSLPAVIKACEVVDGCVGELLQAIDETGGAALVTADHGNADQMWDYAAGGPHTAHTAHPVEAILAGPAARGRSLRTDGGRLADIAPTLLELMGLEQPPEMTGRSLLQPR